MIVSNSNSYIFVHIMKTAGTSVTSMLDRTLAWNDVVLGGTKLGEKIQDPYREKFSIHKHSKAWEIKQVVGDDIWNEYFTFAFVRNPYLRAVSFYTYLETIIHDSGYKKHMRLFRSKNAQSKIWTWPGTKAFMESKGFSGFIRHDHFLSSMGADKQVNWVQDKNGELIVDFIGKVENIYDDFEQISNKLNLKFEDIQKRNPSKNRKDPAQHLSEERDYEYLYDLYKDDFEVLDFDSNFRL